MLLESFLSSLSLSFLSFIYKCTSCGVVAMFKRNDICQGTGTLSGTKDSLPDVMLSSTSTGKCPKLSTASDLRCRGVWAPSGQAVHACAQMPSKDGVKRTWSTWALTSQLWQPHGEYFPTQILEQWMQHTETRHLWPRSCQEATVSLQGKPKNGDICNSENKNAFSFPVISGAFLFLS